MKYVQLAILIFFVIKNFTSGIRPKEALNEDIEEMLNTPGAEILGKKLSFKVYIFAELLLFAIVSIVILCFIPVFTDLLSKILLVSIVLLMVVDTSWFSYLVYKPGKISNTYYIFSRIAATFFVLAWVFLTLNFITYVF